MSTNEKALKIEPAYLGDAVYASFDGYYICLTLDSHENELLVLIGPEVLAALNGYSRAISAAMEFAGEEEQ